MSPKLMPTMVSLPRCDQPKDIHISGATALVIWVTSSAMLDHLRSGVMTTIKLAAAYPKGLVTIK
jgi:hypothetical protein